MPRLVCPRTYRSGRSSIVARLPTVAVSPQQVAVTARDVRSLVRSEPISLDEPNAWLISQARTPEVLALGTPGDHGRRTTDAGTVEVRKAYGPPALP